MTDTKGMDIGISEAQDNNPAAKEKEIASAPAGRRIPKKVEVDLPGPSPPKQSSRKPASKARHSRAPSVASSADGTETPTKPPSVRGAGKASSSRSDSQEEGSDDDAVSIAGSTKAARKRKREPDRIQFFKDDPQCKDIEPHRALCAKCDTWISLHAKRRYVMQSWTEHRKACTGSASVPPDIVSPDARSVPDTAQPTIADTDGRTALEGDSRTGEIRPHEAFCTSCNTWIQLDPTVPYVVTNWKAHTQECPGNIAAPPPDTTPSNDAEMPDQSNPPVRAENPAPAQSTAEPMHLPVPATPSRKRGREEDDVGETPRTVRARPASYTPNRGQALWHTLTKPFRAFVQGFKEGLNASSSSSPPPSSS